MNIKKYIFLDRDGTIIKDKYHMYNLEDIEFLPDVISGLRKLKNQGFEFIIISNQSGVGKGLYSKQQALSFHQEVLNRLAQKKIKIKKSYFCFHKEEDNCFCRKPKTKLAKVAAKDFAINLKESIFIGDKDCDIKLGLRLRSKTILIKNDQYLVKAKPHRIVKKLGDLAEIIPIL